MKIIEAIIGLASKSLLECIGNLLCIGKTMTRTSSLRVRFAPAPTGMMHLGNVRTALFNYLFAQQKGATYILRIEDTDQQRNYDPQAKHIMYDLAWLGLHFDEGPEKGGPDAPYFQSQRDNIYQKELVTLKEKDAIYRCFCTPEELEKKRQRQIALKMPPRYDRTCARLSQADIDTKLKTNIPFIWRVKLNPEASVTIHDLAHGTITFELKNFADFPLTRADGKATFIFANFVDDMLMKITHVIRGEDHLTNTACQAALYEIFNVALPTFWHLPIICNVEGKKLSKRDFGFSLNDLRDAGYLPEAINNYLAIIGGGTFTKDVMTTQELAHEIDFSAMKSTGHVRYDVEKLNWLNHKWITLLPAPDLAERARPFVEKVHPQVAQWEAGKLAHALQILKTDLHTLADAPRIISFLCARPSFIRSDLTAIIPEEVWIKIIHLLRTELGNIAHSADFVSNLKQRAKEANIPLNNMFWALRLALTGEKQGPALHEIIDLLGTHEATHRIQKVIDLF